MKKLYNVARQLADLGMKHSKTVQTTTPGSEAFEQARVRLIQLVAEFDSLAGELEKIAMAYPEVGLLVDHAADLRAFAKEQKEQLARLSKQGAGGA